MDSEIALALTRLGESTDRLLATAGALDDARAAAASRLPGWTRGHILTHLARNADGFRNLLIWARTGTETPMYPGEEFRDRDIEAGATRPAAELTADVRASAATFATAAGELPAAAWDAPVARRGVTFPARAVLPRRLSELEIHHVDLGTGYGPGDWPPDFVQVTLARVADDFAGRPDVPALLVRPDGQDAAYPLGPAGTAAAARPGNRGRPAGCTAGLADRQGQRDRAHGRGGRRPAGAATLAVAGGRAGVEKAATQRKEAAVAYTGDVTVGGPPDTRELPGLTVTKLAVGPMDNNAYLLTCTETGEAALIDAANEAGPPARADRGPAGPADHHHPPALRPLAGARRGAGSHRR